MEKPAGRKKKTQAPKEEAGVPKATVKGEKASKAKRPTKRSARPRKPRKQPVLSPEDEAHIFDAFDASFKDDFEGVPVFIPFQRKKPYECGECGRIFKHKTDHIRHQRVHTGEKPFKCDQCGKTFRHSSDVTKHLRIHTGEKPFKCGECGKAFNCGSNLLKHQKTHTGEKPYGCEECGKTFAYSSCLIRHRKRHLRKKVHRTGPRHRMPCSHIFASGRPWKTPAAVSRWQSPVIPPADRLLVQISPARNLEKSRESVSTSTTGHCRGPLGSCTGGCHHRIHWQQEICRKMSSGRPFGRHRVTPGHLDLLPP